MSDTLSGLGGIFGLASAIAPAGLIWFAKRTPLPEQTAVSMAVAESVEIQRLLAVSAPYASLYDWRHHLMDGGCDAATACRILASWGIHSELELVRHLNALMSSNSQFDRDLIAWDSVRLAFLCRCGYAAGWLGRFSAQRRLTAVTHVLSNRFSSWEELAQHFLLGYGQWSGCLRSEGAMQRRVRKLQRDSRSPWLRLAWQAAEHHDHALQMRNPRLGTNLLVLASAGG